MTHIKLSELKPRVLELAKGKKNLQLRKEIFLPDVEKTVKSYIRYLEANPGNKAYKPYYDNLLEIYQKLS